MGTHAYTRAARLTSAIARQPPRHRHDDLRARVVEAADFERFDLLLAMDESVYERLHRIAPPRHAERVRLFLDYAPQLGRRDVPDPYYGGAAGFEEVLDLVEEAARGLLAALAPAMNYPGVEVLSFARRGGPHRVGLHRLRRRDDRRRYRRLLYDRCRGRRRGWRRGGHGHVRRRFQTLRLRHRRLRGIHPMARVAVAIALRRALHLASGRRILASRAPAAATTAAPAPAATL
jgi:protein-tyrosine phosphatase